MKFVVFILAALLTMASAQSSTAWYNSAATEFEISSAEDLRGLASLVNGITTVRFSGKTIKLTNNIDLGWQNWTPIGNKGTNSFLGTFDGQGYTISGLSVEVVTTSSADVAIGGLFGYIGENGTGASPNGQIKNVNVVASKISAKGYYAYAGGLVGYIRSPNPILNCNVKADTIIAYDGLTTYAGGLAGYTELIYVQNSSVNANIVSAVLAGYVSNSNSRSYAGGLTGYADDERGYNSSEWIKLKFSNNYTSGSVFAFGDDETYAGGLIGLLNNTKRDGDVSDFTNNYTSANVTSSLYAGGLIGRVNNSITIANNYSSGDVTAGKESDSKKSDSYYCGGLFGYWDAGGGATFKYLSTLSNSYASGDILIFNKSAGGGNFYGGGLVGLLTGGKLEMDNNYTSGKIAIDKAEFAKGTYYIGGLIGYMSSAELDITDNYAGGNVFDVNDGSTVYAGGIFGRHMYAEGKQVFKSVYYNSDSTGKAAGIICNTITNCNAAPQSITGISGKTKETLKKQATFKNWDFTGTWSISEDYSMPFLKGINHVGNVDILLPTRIYIYNGSPFEPKPEIWSKNNSGALLKKDIDYIFQYNENKYAGSGAIFVIGINTYKGLYRIVPITILPKEITVSGAQVQTKTYNGTTDAAITGTVLQGVCGSDDVFLINHLTGTFASANANTGIPVTPHMSLHGDDIGNYILKLPALTGKIEPKELAEGAIQPIPQQIYSNAKLTPDVVVKDDTLTLVKDIDYTASYENSTEIGRATVTVTGINNYFGTDSAKFEIINTDIPFVETFESGYEWTFVNGTTNKWVVGTATKNTGSYSAYISNNNGTSNAYTVTSTSIVHLYKDIAFPTSASDFIMNFYYKGRGESGYDFMRVYYSPTTTTPVSGYYSGTQLGTNYNLDSSWSQKTITLPASVFSGKIMRLIFTWRNDNSSGTQPPAAIDDIKIYVSDNPPPSSSSSVSSSSSSVPSSSSVVPSSSSSTVSLPKITNWYDDDPDATEFEISSAEELRGLAELVNRTTTVRFAGKTIKLANDIDLGGENWVPIGNSVSNSFLGTFDGQGRTVSGLSVAINSSAATAYGGLFGYAGTDGIGETAQIKNVNVIASKIEVKAATNAYAGGLAGFYRSRHSILNCNVKADTIIAGNATNTYAGGLAGYTHSAAISNSNAHGNIVSAAASNAYAGGLTGYANDESGVYTLEFSKNYASGSVSASGNNTSYAGGLIGHLVNGGTAAYTSTFTDNYASANVFSFGSIAYAGGLIGYGNSAIIITNSYASGDVTAYKQGGPNTNNYYCGGLIGYLYGGYLYGGPFAIRNSYSSGYLSVNNTVEAGGNFQCGGLVGYIGGSTPVEISNSYTSGQITSNKADSGVYYLGGLIGNMGNNIELAITNSYVGGNAVGIFGRLVYNENKQTFTSVYYNSDSASKSDVPGIFDKASEALRKKATFINWDFTGIWNISENYSMPFLKGINHVGNVDILLPTRIYTYTGSPINPKPEVWSKNNGGALLKKDVDYIFQYDENKYAGSGAITVIGIGAYDGLYRTIPITIMPKELTVLGAQVQTKTYDGTTNATIIGAILQGVCLSDDVHLINLIGTFASANVGTEIPVTSHMSLGGSASGNYFLTQPVLTGTIKSKALAEDAIQYIPQQIYSNAKLTPEVVVKDDTLTLVKDIDYTVSYEDNIEIGFAKVTITGINNYFGTATAEFEIISSHIPLVETFESGYEWTFVNGTQTNKWVIGTATKNTGSYSAYISNNNGTSNAYDISTSSIVHFYKDIKFPTSASDFILTFYFKGSGEQGYDFMRVYHSPTTTTPVAGSYSGTQLGVNYNLNPSWSQKTITLPASVFSGQTRRLIFTWRNDGSIGTQPPAAIDDIRIYISGDPLPSSSSSEPSSSSNISSSSSLPSSSSVKPSSSSTTPSSSSTIPSSSSAKPSSSSTIPSSSSVAPSSSSSLPSSSSLEEHSSSSSDGITVGLPRITISNIYAHATGNVIVLGNVPRNAKIEVYNLRGELIHIVRAENVQPLLQIPVQTKGLYVVKVALGSESKVLKVPVN
ncbi:MAG: YDG domain-containing protein [Fibromonadales bacterium]|nr:YDG domain-containing protein [Fibromonadales bacterium]